MWPRRFAPWHAHGGSVTDRRAILFDLDDTLYPYRAFVDSGFRAVARAVESIRGVPASVTIRVLRRARLDGHRGAELQRLCAVCFLPDAMVHTLHRLLVDHEPALRLPSASRTVLARLRPDWRIGVLTNGDPSVQRRKVRALGLDALVDAVVCANEHGDGIGKPDPQAFAAALDRLGGQPQTTVFVGNDPEADIAGAAAAGLLTIHVRRAGAPAADGDVCLSTLRAVPEAAARLVDSKELAYAL